MELKQSLNHGQWQKQSQQQHLVMTQQLQQSIQILNYNSDDLRQFIEERALENPFLDIEVNEDIPQMTVRSQMTASDVQQYINQLPDRYDSLYRALEEQIKLNYRHTPIRQAMFLLLDYIDENGYLRADLHDLVNETFSYTMLLDALTLIQQLEPAGVGARHLQECLLLQIERDEASPNIAYLVLEDSFDDFVNRKWDKIAKRYGVTLCDIQEVSDYVLTLTPHPGNIFQPLVEQYIIPDLKVSVDDGDITIQSNRGSLPKISLATSYYTSIKQTGNDEALHFANEKKNEVRWLEKSIKQRQDTILEVGKAIVQHQRLFFLDDKHPLQPLTLKTIAEELSLHESTISRAVNGKYLETTFGVFELKTFFVAKIGKDDDSVAVNEVKEVIQKMINDEDKRKPLSDAKIVDQLTAQGYQISRRTVAKYRDALNIPSSTKRKRYDGL